MTEVKLPSDDVFGEAEFSRGFVRDMPRSSIPAGGVYDSLDFLIDRPGVAYKRGGFTYQGDQLGGLNSGVVFVAAPEFPTGTKVCALVNNVLYDITSSTVGGTVNAGGFGGLTTRDNPHLWVDRLIVPDALGLSGPRKVEAPGGVLTSTPMGGSPPAGRYVTVHLSRVILASSAAVPHRLWFSPVPTPETGSWNVSNSYIDTNHQITAITPCQGVLLVFSDGHTERVVGDIIPGEVGENMSVQPVGEVGCADARSIAPWRGNVIFAGQGGVWVTNGVGFDSLTEKDDGSGISTYWRQLFDAWASSTGTPGDLFIAGGVYARDFYIVTLGHVQGVYFDTLVCYLPRKSWMRFDNVVGRSYATQVTGKNELYVGTSTGNPGDRVLRTSSMFNPSSSNMNDADGRPVEPELHLRMIGEGIGLKAHGHGHLTYDMRHPSASPTLQVEAATGIEATGGFTPVAEGTPMQKTTMVTRSRFIVNRDAQTLNLRFKQAGSSEQTEVYAIEQEVRSYNVTADGF